MPIGEVPPTIVLEGDLGGRVDGTPWNSEELVSGKIIVLFYVDPDESDLNNHVSDALKAENFPLDKYGSVGVANMAATWLPNFAINIKLKSKQEKHKSTVYVKDLEKTLYTFVLDDGKEIQIPGNEEVEYDGEIHTAANLFDALKEGYYGKF